MKKVVLFGVFMVLAGLISAQEVKVSFDSPKGENPILFEKETLKINVEKGILMIDGAKNNNETQLFIKIQSTASGKYYGTYGNVPAGGKNEFSDDENPGFAPVGDGSLPETEDFAFNPTEARGMCTNMLYYHDGVNYSEAITTKSEIELINNNGKLSGTIKAFFINGGWCTIT